MIWLLGGGAIVLLFALAVLFGAPYVPSQPRYVRRAFRDLYPLTEKDTLVDIGAGDGIVLRLARERKAAAVGYEINPLLVLLGRWLSRRDERVRVVLRNFWHQPLPSETTVVYAFSVHRDGKRLADKLRKEANRLGRPLALLCLGSPLPGLTPEATLDAYFLYRFTPGHTKEVTL